jgi:hypothetical protein
MTRFTSARGGRAILAAMSARSLFVVAALLAAPGAAQRLYVDASVASDGNGSSWAAAFRTLQPALAAANAGTEIWVAEGTYVGGFALPAGVTVLGGFRSGQTAPAQRFVSFATVTLSGGGTQRVVRMGAGSVLDGVVVRDGAPADALGGGGALIDGVAATIRNARFTANLAGSGRGSAINLVNGGDLRLSNSAFDRNGAATSGAHVIDVTTATALVDHIVVWDNFGNGFHFRQGTVVRIHGSVFARNTGRGICHIDAADQPTIENNLLWNNAIALMHVRGSELQTIAEVNALSYARANITGDPQFVDAAGGDFRLVAGAPGVDAGNAIAELGTRDLHGNGRLLDGDLDGLAAPDIGVAERSNVTLRASGAFQAGGSLTIGLDGAAGLPAAVVFGARSHAGILVGAFGHWFQDPAALVVAVPWGPLPASRTLAIPADAPPGSVVALQAFAANATGGNLSNGVELLIR